MTRGERPAWLSDYNGQRMDAAEIPGIDDADGERATVLIESGASGRYVASTVDAYDYLDGETV